VVLVHGASADGSSWRAERTASLATVGGAVSFGPPPSARAAGTIAQCFGAVGPIPYGSLIGSGANRAA
jgi:hypothetical protein